MYFCAIRIAKSASGTTHRLRYGNARLLMCDDALDDTTTLILRLPWAKVGQIPKTHGSAPEKVSSPLLFGEARRQVGARFFR